MEQHRLIGEYLCVCAAGGKGPAWATVALEQIRRELIKDARDAFYTEPPDWTTTGNVDLKLQSARLIKCLLSISNPEVTVQDVEHAPSSSDGR